MSKHDSDLRSLLRDALELQRNSAPSPEVVQEIDPWTPGRVIRLFAQPSNTDLGWYQEFLRADARKLEHVLAGPLSASVEHILDPWHEPQSISRMTPEELEVIRRTTPTEWTPRWKHRNNPPKVVDVEALLRELS